MRRASKRAGHWRLQDGGVVDHHAFIPAPLPPAPPLRFNVELQRLGEATGHALGRLEGIAGASDVEHFRFLFMRREAICSCALDGSRATLFDLLAHEAESDRAALGDVRAVARHLKAAKHGVAMLRAGKLPLSLRLLRNIHRVLVKEERRTHPLAGEFRRTAVWIGSRRPQEAVYVPPPPAEMLAALDNLERFIHQRHGTPSPIVKAGIAYAQFLLIHPFLEANGRMARLLAMLMLINDGVLSEPLLYLCAYFAEHEGAYDTALARLLTHGDWEGWVRFYLTAVRGVATHATDTVTAMQGVFDRDRARIATLGRAAESARCAHEVARCRVVVSITQVAEEAKMTWPTAKAALLRLAELGIVEESTGKQRGRLFVHTKQMALLQRPVRR